ncbi:MAG: hypothetical protein IKM87_04945 [Clostridia bacterium]|jgi:hypothetical protein|nr:hypothetical protein [Clostridia bacterium]MBR6822490.1 hypothetical protein [Clostridia bacterium]
MYPLLVKKDTGHIIWEKIKLNYKMKIGVYRMKKFFKLLVLISFVSIVFISIAFADTYHAGKSFTIPGSDLQSDACNWTPAFNIPSGNLYVKSYANLANPTGMTEYYRVCPSASSYTTTKIPIDGTLYTRSTSMAATGGVSYAAHAIKWDSILTVSITGKIYFYSKNNS